MQCALIAAFYLILLSIPTLSSILSVKELYLSSKCKDKEFEGAPITCVKEARTVVASKQVCTAFVAVVVSLARKMLLARDFAKRNRKRKATIVVSVCPKIIVVSYFLSEASKNHCKYMYQKYYDTRLILGEQHTHTGALMPIFAHFNQKVAPPRGTASHDLSRVPIFCYTKRQM